MASQDARLSKFEADFKQQQRDMTNKIDIVLKAITDRITGALPRDTTLFDVMNIKTNNDSHKEEPEVGENAGVGELEAGYFDVLSTRSELAYHRKLDPRENKNGGVNNFTGRIKGMHVFVGNFAYVIDFMIVEDISSIIDPMLSQVVLEKPFVEISNMTHDPPAGVVIFDEKKLEVLRKFH
ncbi:hypothetical protein Tco_1491984 [Tanacetum coccineum]